MTLPLEGIVVVDQSGTIATAYCAKLLADGGAAVWNVEPTAGFVTRTLPPKVGDAKGLDANGVDRSALHAYLSTNKHSIVIEQDGLAWQQLARASHLILHDGQPRLPIPDNRLSLAISWFGSDGPYSSFQGSDAACHALCGLIRGIGPIEGPPLIPSGYQAQINAGAVAYIPALSHILGGERGLACAARLEVSILEASLCFTEVQPIAAYNDAVSTRMGINRFPPTYPLGIYRCHDGWLGITALTPSQWASLCSLIGMDDIAAKPEYQTALGRLADAEILEPRIRALLADRSAEATFYEGQRRRIPLARVPTPEELFNVDQFVARQTFAEAILPSNARVQVPVTPWRLRRTPLRRAGRVSALNEHGPLPHSTPATATGDQLPLQDIRIIDLSMGWAGPLAARHLADLGADVIKVESCERFDWWRSWEATPEWIASQGAERAVAFNMVNRNKRDITLDLEHPDGKALLLQLVKGAHAVLENYSAGVLPQLGLTYDVLKTANPDIILLSMPAFGTTGPWAGFRAYGSTVEHASGLPHLNGRPEDPPTMLHVAYGDAIGGIYGAGCLLTALRHQARTGEGQFMDLSQVEALLPVSIHGILKFAVHGKSWSRTGNTDLKYSPHGVFPCLGEDAWIVIQIMNEVMWRRLQTLAAPSLAGFGDLTDRLARRDQLESILTQWTMVHAPDELMMKLQGTGILAARVSHPIDVLTDEHLCARGFWQWIERDVVGLQPNPSAPYRIISPQGATQALSIRQPSPTLGQHNAEVLAGLLGLSADQLKALEADGVIGSLPRMPKRA